MSCQRAPVVQKSTCKRSRVRTSVCETRNFEAAVGLHLAGAVRRRVSPLLLPACPAGARRACSRCWPRARSVGASRRPARVASRLFRCVGRTRRRRVRRRPAGASERSRGADRSPGRARGESGARAAQIRRRGREPPDPKQDTQLHPLARARGAAYAARLGPGGRPGTWAAPRGVFSACALVYEACQLA